MWKPYLFYFLFTNNYWNNFRDINLKNACVNVSLKIFYFTGKTFFVVVVCVFILNEKKYKDQSFGIINLIHVVKCFKSVSLLFFSVKVFIIY